MVSNEAEKSSSTKGIGLPLDKDKLTYVLWREELSLKDLFHMRTGLGCLSHLHGYIFNSCSATTRSSLSI